MNTKKVFAVLSTLCAASALFACSQQSISPAPDKSSAPAYKPQNEPSQGKQGAPAASLDEVKQRVAVMFSGYEHSVSRDELLRAGTEQQLVTVLTTLATDEQAQFRHRMHAVTSMQLFPRAETKAALEQIIVDEKFSNALRRPAVRAFGAGFGADAVPLLAKTLDHGDRNTRDAAIRALAKIHTPDARKAIELRIPAETDKALVALGNTTLTTWK